MSWSQDSSGSEPFFWEIKHREWNGMKRMARADHASPQVISNDRFHPKFLREKGSDACRYPSLILDALLQFIPFVID